MAEWNTGQVILGEYAIKKELGRGCDPMEVILRGEIVPISRRVPGIPKALAAVLDKAIQAKPQRSLSGCARNVGCVEEGGGLMCGLM